MKESIVESSKETARIRLFKIYYYLTDDTLEISEEREVNSGILQGPYLKRRKVKNLNLIKRLNSICWPKEMIAN